jgi:hypothetical protein
LEFWRMGFCDRLLECDSLECNLISKRELGCFRETIEFF